MASPSTQLCDEGSTRVLGPAAGLPMCYKRTVSDPRIAAQEAVQRAYTLPGVSVEARIASSGMNAVMCALQAVIQRNLSRGSAVILHGNELYSDTLDGIIPYLSQMYRHVTFIDFDVCNTAQFSQLCWQHQNELIGVFVESASNPSGHMLDWAAVPRALSANHNGSGLIVDNTWLSSALFNPFQVGASIVVESCSKYNTGGHAIMGVVVSRGKVNKHYCDQFIRTYGIHVSEAYCACLIDGMASLPQRMRTISDRTISVLVNLRKAGISVMHPALEDHPHHAIFRRHVPVAYPGVFRFWVPGVQLDKKDMPALCAEAALHLATSFGKSTSLVCMWPKSNKDGTWVRASVGLSDDLAAFVQSLKDFWHLSTTLGNK